MRTRDNTYIGQRSLTEIYATIVARQIARRRFKAASQTRQELGVRWSDVHSVIAKLGL